MSDTPKVGEEGWAWRGIGNSSTANLYPCKILERNVDEYSKVQYFVSYDSSASGRRSVNIVSCYDLVKVPVKVVSYQLMSVKESGYVASYGSVYCKEVADQWCRAAKHHNEKLFIQRTEVTGDKIEVFVERVL